MPDHALPFDHGAVSEYLRTLYGEAAELHEAKALGADGAQDLKAFGYGQPVLLRFSVDGDEREQVLHTMSGDAFGHERMPDRAAHLLLDHATFNTLPRHVPAADVGAVAEDGRLLSLGNPQEFFLLTDYAPGRPYARDLARVAQEHSLSDDDEERARTLAAYLADIHGEQREDAPLYQRRIRDLVGNGEGIMGMLDSYPAAGSRFDAQLLEAIERECVRWRWRIKSHTDRLSQVHGDFHPWNILFDENGEFALLDRSRGAWGEPADDVTALAINYLFFAQQAEEARPLFERLFYLFWHEYIRATGDQELQAVAPPFFAWRGLVLAHPVWYPDLDDMTRSAMLTFVQRVLETDAFDPTRLDIYFTEI